MCALLCVLHCVWLCELFLLCDTAHVCQCAGVNVCVDDWLLQWVLLWMLWCVTVFAMCFLCVSVWALQCRCHCVLHCVARNTQTSVFTQAGNIAKALDLAFTTKQFAALQLISNDLNENTDPQLLQRCANFLIQNDHHDKAVNLLALGKKVVICFFLMQVYHAVHTKLFSFPEWLFLIGYSDALPFQHVTHLFSLLSYRGLLSIYYCPSFL